MSADLIERIPTGYTPGPWRINKRAGALVEGTHGRSVCSTGGYSDSLNFDAVFAENAANAALIALAPELATALTAAEARIAELEAALSEAERTLENYADPTGYTDNFGDQYEPDEGVHPGLLAAETLRVVRAALKPEAGK